MGNELFSDLCKRVVQTYYYRELKKNISLKDIYVCWMVKVLQNNKALVSTTLPDGRYFEVTYSGDKREVYLDVYGKESNTFFSIPIETESGVKEAHYRWLNAN